MKKFKYIILESDSEVEIKLYKSDENINLSVEELLKKAKASINKLLGSAGSAAESIKNAVAKGYNPFRDATGRFASATTNKLSDISNSIKDKFSGSNSIEFNLSNIISSNNIDANLLNNLNYSLADIVSNISKDVSGLNNKVINGIKFYDDGETYRSLINLPSSISSAVLGFIDGDKNIYMSDKIFNSLTTGIAHSGMRIEDIKSAVAHEIFHTRDRKYPMPFESDKKAINLSNYSMSMEEGFNESMARLYMLKKNVSQTLTGIGYNEEVTAVLDEARARFPTNREKAIKWISDTHKTGFTLDGIKESFGDYSYSYDYVKKESIKRKLDYNELIKKYDGHTEKIATEILHKRSNLFVTDNMDKIVRSWYDEPAMGGFGPRNSNNIKLEVSSNNISLSDIIDLINKEKYTELKLLIESNSNIKHMFANLLLRLKNKNIILKFLSNI